MRNIKIPAKGPTLVRFSALLEPYQLEWLRQIADSNQISLNEALRAILEVAMENFEATNLTNGSRR